MKQKNIEIRGKNISLRLININDIPEYFKKGFETIDEEVQKYTGTNYVPTKEDIKNYVEGIVEDDSRYDFLIIDYENQIIGESVINEIDNENNSANFRIAIFKSINFGRGIGTEAIQMTLKFAFEKLNLHRIELEVFSFNKRAYASYQKSGFVEEGRRRKAVLINGEYHDAIIMGILREEYIHMVNQLILVDRLLSRDVSPKIEENLTS